MISKELDEYLEKYYDYIDDNLIDPSTISFKDVQKDIDALPKDAKVFAMNMIDNYIYTRNILMDSIIIELYIACLEYMYIEEAKDGFHAAKIARFYLHYSHMIGNENEECDDYTYIKENQQNLYEYAKRYVNISICYNRNILYDCMDTSDINIENSNKYLDISDNIPDEVPEELYLDKLLDYGWLDIIDKYKTKDCKSKFIFI